MTETMGLGICLITKDDGLPCGLQISEGEPIGTVILGLGPIIGHKKCADEFLIRKKEQQDMVQIGKQQGPGGAIPNQFEDAIQGSIPLEKKPEPEPQPEVVIEDSVPFTPPVEVIEEPAPERGWAPDDFPQVTAAFIPYASSVALRPDPSISVQNEGWLFIDIGNMRLAIPNREEWDKLTFMVDSLWQTHESKQDEPS